MQYNAASSPSRRRLLATAGGIGAVAATAGIIGAVSMKDDDQAAAKLVDNDAATTASMANLDGDIVVHLADPAAGTLDVFAGTRHFQVTDKDLAARLVRAASAS